MKRLLGVAALALGVVVSGAAAEEDDGIFGNWEGKIASGDRAGQVITAKIISRGTDGVEGFLILEGGDRVDVRGRKSDGRADLEGKGENGASIFSGAIADGVFRGSLPSKKGPMSFDMTRVFHTSPTLGATPPADATVLLGPGSTLEEWVRYPEKYPLVGDGVMRVASSSMVTRQEFGGHSMHLEFMTPFMPRESGQGRGNSGVYILGRYEIQVLDSFGDEPADNLCGGIYKQATPLTNACLPPLQWQTYDVTFYPAQFDAAGQKTANARITVVHNGVLIHDNIELTAPTPGGVSELDAPAGPLLLQNHGDPVEYRNIWIRPVTEEAAAGPVTAQALEELPEVFVDDFEAGLDKWEFTDPNAWRIEEAGGKKTAALFQASDYKPEVRSPFNIAWAKGLNVTDFVMDVWAEQTGREYGHRDLCFFFGKQDAAHFYYAHLATQADEHANSIFLVNGAPRVSIAQERTAGTDWATGFQHIRVTRDVENGLIEVFFNDMDKPVMRTVDKTFTSGPIGIGSFDDVGLFDKVIVRGRLAGQ